MKAIVEAYYILIEDREKFYDWFTLENSEGITPLDLAAQYSNREIIKFLYDIIKKTNESRLKLVEKRSNFFHYAAKANQCYPIVNIFLFLPPPTNKK